MTVRELLAAAYDILKQSGIVTYHTDAQLMLAKAINRDRLYVLTNQDFTVASRHRELFLSDINKRAESCPLQYIIGKCEFYSMNFFAERDVLIPREDTEILTGLSIEIIDRRQGPMKILEIGTGSGVIAVSIAKHCKNADVTAVDISPSAIRAAKKNARLHNARIDFIESDIFGGLNRDTGSFDCIISNPPYIKSGELSKLDKSVSEYEPRTALDGGADGLVFYRKIAGGASTGRYLKETGMILLEIGHDQAGAVTEILTERGFGGIEIKKDLAGRDRVVTAVKCF